MKQLLIVIMCVSFFVGNLYASGSDIIIDKLLEKGVINIGEAQELKMEAEEVSRMGQQLSNKGKASFGGKAYLNYKADEDGAGNFDASRIYLDMKRQLGDNLLRYTTDISGSMVDGKDYWTVYTKYLYVDFTNLIPNTTIQFGQFGTPWIGWVDKIHGFRYIAKSTTDYYKILSSADRGIGFKTKLPNNINLQGCLINGEGYKNDNDGDERFDIALRADWRSRKNDGFVVAAHTQLSGTEVTDADGDKESEKSVYNILLGYQEGTDWTIAGEMYSGRVSLKDISGFSVFGNFSPAEKVRLLARYDSYDPDVDADDDEKTLVIAGVQYELAEKVKSSINIKQTKTGDEDAFSTYYLDMEVNI